VKLKITTLAEEERGMDAAGPWDGCVLKDHSGKVVNERSRAIQRRNDKRRAWSRTRGRGGWKAISSHGVPAVLISDEKAKCGPDFSFQSSSYRRLFYFSFQ
jgi:hypothetical protein